MREVFSSKIFHGLTIILNCKRTGLNDVSMKQSIFHIQKQISWLFFRVGKIYCYAHYSIVFGHNFRGRSLRGEKTASEGYPPPPWKKSSLRVVLGQVHLMGSVCFLEASTKITFYIVKLRVDENCYGLNPFKTIATGSFFLCFAFTDSISVITGISYIDGALD